MGGRQGGTLAGGVWRRSGQRDHLSNAALIVALFAKRFSSRPGLLARERDIEIEGLFVSKHVLSSVCVYVCRSQRVCVMASIFD